MLSRQVITAIFAALVSQGLVISALPNSEPNNNWRSEWLNNKSSKEAQGLQVIRAALEQPYHDQGHGSHNARALVVRATASEIFA